MRFSWSGILALVVIALIVGSGFGMLIQQRMDPPVNGPTPCSYCGAPIAIDVCEPCLGGAPFAEPVEAEADALPAFPDFEDNNEVTHGD